MGNRNLDSKLASALMVVGVIIVSITIFIIFMLIFKKSEIEGIAVMLVGNFLFMGFGLLFILFGMFFKKD